MAHDAGCLLCGAELVYSDVSRELHCALCGACERATATCRSEHFVCNGCHRSQAIDWLEQRAGETTHQDPLSLAHELLQGPGVAMHGPEHHFLAAAALLAAYDNALGQPENKAGHLTEARRRAEQVPGGFCGTHGGCGAALGAGIFWSVVTGATPLSREPWAEANRLTATCLLRIADHGGPRCCKRNTWHSLLQTKLEIGRRLPETAWSADVELPYCDYARNNAQCLLKACVFHPAAHKLRAGVSR